ncbi:putative rna polymerase II ctd phosphatase [Schistosoma mansoni]|uniref:putative rna polymerase II ctd phosphatase n=1 Tax=Schistosoma mansoni TaxID=6183 RepID=UPI0001A636FD|nr:putative rna polymerase II ctd phosphatase [Schistosoma mansoni]|eukprot:XP_018655628.1 putative rna polymerase II ctd phosphatase [Schistosoma mansoni]
MATAASSSKQPVCVPDNVTGDKVVHWKIHRRQLVNPSVSICELVDDASGRIDIRAPGYGWVTKMKDEGATVVPGCVLFNFLPCTHHVVMKDLCAECGANLRREGGISGERITDASASIPMVHAIPELHVSETVADEIALQDQQSLLAARKLVLLVDLDQTIIHTTNDPQAFKYKNVHRYRLPGSPLVYHTRLRPHLEKVLDCLSQYYQMHICTFGNRVYAHQLASMIDPKRRYFSQRILSRDECFNPVTKSANLKALFPRGLNLVCIIDDRGEVWDWSSNLIHVKPYRFFPDIGDINAFPWSSQSSPLSSSSIPTSSSFGSCTSTSTKVTESSSSLLSNCSNVQLIDKSDENVNSQVSEVNENIISHDVETKSNNNDNTTTAINNTEKPVRCTVDKTNDNPSVTTTDNNDIEFCQTQSTNANVTLKSSKSTDNIGDHIDDNPTTTAVVDNDDEIQLTSSEKDHNSDSLSKIKEIEIEMDAADDDYLLRLQEILLRIHRNYFKTYDLWQTGHYHHHHHHQTTLMTKASENKYSDHSTNSSIVNNSRKNVCLTNPTGNTDVPVHLPHVSDIIAKLRKTVLGPNCHITLSGLSPAHFPADRCLAGRIVRSLGGILHASLRLPSICNQSNVDDDNKNGDNTTSIPVNKLELKSESHGIAHSVSTHYTTHLIACRRGTEKVHAALKYLTINDNLQLNNNSSSHSLHLVSPQWLWSCHYHWDHVCELKYPLDRDFHPSDFDPDIEPIPGTIRYAKLSCFIEMKYNFFLTNIVLFSAIIIFSEQKIPRLDPSVVRSALDSIRTERENDRKRKLRRKSKNKRHHKRHRRDSSHHEDAKEKNISLIDNLTINDQGGLMFGNESSSSSSSSPSLKSDSSIESDLDHHDGQPNNSSLSSSSMEHSTKQETIISTENSKLACLFDESLCDHSEICQNKSIINCDLCKSNSLLLCNSDKLIMKSPAVINPYVTEIKDEGDQDFNEYTITGNPIELNDDKEEREGTRNTEQFNGDDEDATGKMLAEIEDAVLEEVTERATSIPREAEIYDPAVDNFNDTSSTDSSSDNQTSVIELTKFHKSHITTNELPKNPMECDRRTLNWQVQRELLVRRRHRASPVETTKIDRKIRRLDQRFRRESRRRRSCDDLIFESMKSINSDNDNFFNESDSDCDSYDADYPKGWGPDEHVHKVSKHRFSSQKRWLIGSHHHKFSRLSVSPAIHSDPEPNVNWWIQDTEDVENKEWNTCPEGYDYADAERTREIMYDSRRDRYESCKYENNIAYQQRGHGNLTRCLFGADDNPEDINQSSADDEDAEDVIGPVSDISIGEDSGELGNDEDDDEEEEDEDLTDERWDPLREFM